MKKEPEIQKARATSGTSCASTGFLSVRLKYENKYNLRKAQCFVKKIVKNSSFLF